MKVLVILFQRISKCVNNFCLICISMNYLKTHHIYLNSQLISYIWIYIWIMHLEQMRLCQISRYAGTLPRPFCMCWPLNLGVMFYQPWTREGPKSSSELCVCCLIWIWNLAHCVLLCMVVILGMQKGTCFCNSPRNSSMVFPEPKLDFASSTVFWAQKFIFLGALSQTHECYF